MLIDTTEYGYYYYQIHPETNIDNALMKGSDMIFNGFIHYTGHEES